MKLLIESWRKFLNEGEGAYFPWIEELRNDPEKFISDQQGKATEGGEGSYRVVVVPDSDPDFVVKIIKQEDELFTNKIEKILGDEYPEVFPTGVFRLIYETKNWLRKLSLQQCLNFMNLLVKYIQNKITIQILTHTMFLCIF